MFYSAIFFVEFFFDLLKYCRTQTNKTVELSPVSFDLSLTVRRMKGLDHSNELNESREIKVSASLRFGIGLMSTKNQCRVHYHIRKRLMHYLQKRRNIY